MKYKKYILSLAALLSLVSCNFSSPNSSESSDTISGSLSVETPSSESSNNEVSSINSEISSQSSETSSLASSEEDSSVTSSETTSVSTDLAGVKNLNLVLENTYGDFYGRINYGDGFDVSNVTEVKVNGIEKRWHEFLNNLTVMNLKLTDVAGYPEKEYVIEFYNGTTLLARGTVTVGSTVTPDPVNPDDPIDPTDYVPENYSLIWNDEFNGNSLDESKWTYEIGTGSWGWGNNEQQYYRRENLSVSDGMMTITAKKENYASSKYTSSRIKTQGKFSFTYGYVEARISCPSMSGIWPAFWTLGDKLSTLGWPYCGELDIMEEINSENIVYSTMHWNNAQYNQYAPVDYGKKITINDRTDFHVYAMKWTEDKVWTYCDGNVILDGALINDDFKKLAFNNSHFLILNLAVGGNWPGFNIADNFPQKMVVDYVRVYQEKQ